MGRRNWINDTPKGEAQATQALGPKAPTLSRASIGSQLPARVMLPSNLPEALKQLDDTQLQTLLRDVTAEIDRRGAEPVKAVDPSEPTEKASRRKTSAGPRQASAEAEVPEGKANMIRASFKAGMKPTAIARSLRISRLNVNRVLGAPEKPKR